MPIHSSKKGFSLIELMVSLSIFSIVMTIAIGTLLVMVDANGKAQALSSAMTNISFALDSMTRTIRTGKEYYCMNTNDVAGIDQGQDGLHRFAEDEGSVNDCDNGVSTNNAIVFTPGFEENTRIAYRLNGPVLEQWIDRKSRADAWVPITSNQPPMEVFVRTLRFTVDGSSNNIVDGNFAQPRITLNIAGDVQNGLDTPTAFQVQSNVTQRVLDF